MDETSRQTIAPIGVDPQPGTLRPDSTRRFSGRVENYVKYRPGYPPEVLDYLRDTAGLTSRSVVADVGCGTGISALPFLRHGCTVLGVEPNAEMRQAAERFLRDYPRFRSIAGTAEATTLAAGWVDLVTAGQAFHWFDPTKAKAEFRRVLRPGGKVVLMWNRRKTAGTPFLEAYEQLLLQFAADYQAVRHENVDSQALAAFFRNDSYAAAVFPNHQSFDFEGLSGRLLSSSYAPAPGQPTHGDMMRALRSLFERFNSGGRVAFDYDTQVFAGEVSAATGT